MMLRRRDAASLLAKAGHELPSDLQERVPPMAYAEDVETPLQARNRYCYGAWQRGDFLHSIAAVITKTPGWPQIQSNQAIKKAAKAHQTRFPDLPPVSKRKPGPK
jgi:hypothetical protein